MLPMMGSSRMECCALRLLVSDLLLTRCRASGRAGAEKEPVEARTPPIATKPTSPPPVGEARTARGQAGRHWRTRQRLGRLAVTMPAACRWVCVLGAFLCAANERAIEESAREAVVLGAPRIGA
jgi:hypothetical protein